MKVITFLNEKGGVGKTTLSTHVAAGLAIKGHRVLLIDGDAQANATTQMGIRPRGGLYNVIVKDDAEWKDTLTTTANMVWRQGYDKVGELYVLPGNIETRAIPLVTDNTRALHDRLDELDGHLDYVIIDTSPSPSLTHAMFYIASDYVVIPTEAHALSIAGVANTIKRIKEINVQRQAHGFKPLELLGIAINKLRMNTNAHHTGIAFITEKLGKDKLLPFIMDRTVWRDREYQNQTMFTYAPDDVATAEIWEFVNALEAGTNSVRKQLKGSA